ncbi:UNVERIFIED_CONTAM: hypothetical protein Sradi_5487400 [Sesamum radiatum]|uniref:Uncharacterized protein n=1 Tax=Sesamum radiatum TaxID=300843 RepID=A0AAW2LBT1_SESRA
MLGKKLGSMKKLAKKVKVIGNADRDPSPYECLLRDNDGGASSPTTTTPTGTFVVYVGDDRQRFVVPTGYLSHPLFKILLEKAIMSLDLTKGMVWWCHAVWLRSKKW